MVRDDNFFAGVNGRAFRTRGFDFKKDESPFYSFLQLDGDRKRKRDSSVVLVHRY